MLSLLVHYESLVGRSQQGRSWSSSSPSRAAPDASLSAGSCERDPLMRRLVPPCTIAVARNAALVQPRSNRVCRHDLPIGATVLGSFERGERSNSAHQPPDVEPNLLERVMARLELGCNVGRVRNVSARIDPFPRHLSESLPNCGRKHVSKCLSYDLLAWIETVRGTPS